MRQMSSIRLFMIMGLVWIGLGTFGLTFDPDKKWIILSQFIAGIMCFAYYWVFKHIPILQLADGILFVQRRIFHREKIPADQILNVEEGPEIIIFRIKDDRDVVIQRSALHSQEVQLFLNTLQDSMDETTAYTAN